MKKWLIRIFFIIVTLLAIVFLIFRTPDTDPAQMRAKYGSTPSQFVKIGGGVTVHLRDEGPLNGDSDAPVIILLHGSAADLHTWQPWAEGLRDTYRVIRFDQIGHGLTGADPAGDYSVDNFVADIDEVADALKLDTFILAGNSMGGSHALAYAIEHSERLDGLVLVDAGGASIKTESKGNLGFSIARTPGVNQIMRYITPRSIIERSLRQSVSNESVVTDRYWELLRYPGNRAATIARFGRGWSTFTEDQIAAIEVPTLILWGEEDRLISVEAGRWFDRVIPESELVTYPGIGHLPQEEATEATLSDLEKWLIKRNFTT